MEQFSNAAFWGRHPMPYFKIPRTEKYGMQCANYRLVKFLQQCDNNALAPQRRDTIPMFFGQILQITNVSCSEHIFFYPSCSAEREL